MIPCTVSDCLLILVVVPLRITTWQKILALNRTPIEPLTCVQVFISKAAVLKLFGVRTAVHS